MDNRHDLKLAAAELDAALEKAQNISNPNLLDSWYFGNPVNQRGRTEYTGWGYCIDRWMAMTEDQAVIVQNGYIRMLATNAENSYACIDQPIENFSEFLGKQLTFSVLVNGAIGSVIALHIGVWKITSYQEISGSGWQLLKVIGTVTDDTEKSVRIYFNESKQLNNPIDILAVKLELGTQQTLAHQDENGNWVLNEIPNYTEELAKCQRYYQVYDNHIWMIPCKDNVWRLNHAFPVAMRVAPAVVSHEAISDKEATVTFDSVTANGVSAFGTGDGQYVAVSNIVFDANL